ncbi:MAG: hypothetical protein ABEJ93_01770 [Candidatus Nanohalobium sp.]
MDRKVFSMVAATVFLLTMIVATIQMQFSMIESAAEEVKTDFRGYAYPMAGALHMINADNNMKMGRWHRSNVKGYNNGHIQVDYDHLQDLCVYMENGDQVGGFARDEAIYIQSAGALSGNFLQGHIPMNCKDRWSDEGLYITLQEYNQTGSPDYKSFTVEIRSVRR